MDDVQTVLDAITAKPGPVAVAFERLQWEEERQMAAQASCEAFAAEMTASRPDMYLPA